MSPVDMSIPASARIVVRRSSACSTSTSNTTISRRLSPRRRTSSRPSVISLMDASKRFSKQQRVRRRRATFSPPLRYSRDIYTDDQTSSITSSDSMESEYDSDFSDASSQYSASSPHPLASSSQYKHPLPRALRTCDELDLVFGSIAGDWFSWLTPAILNASTRLQSRTGYASPTESSAPSDSKRRSPH